MHLKHILEGAFLTHAILIVRRVVIRYARSIHFGFMLKISCNIYLQLMYKNFSFVKILLPFHSLILLLTPYPLSQLKVTQLASILSKKRA